MSLFETGRLCVKTAGREAGKLCVVIDKAEGDLVAVTGPKILTGVRKRKCNIAHLEPLDCKIKIKADAADDEILGLLGKDT
ncbi:MAG: 50S ribosomal protein L14e [Candidatus Aenigmarchaeota archaeon]|nr:50S ribosomal protein L14e [Candidatus Aenigmarchaeota archaeon]